MKVAIITEDGKTISQHFGRAPFYLVVTIEDGKIINREMREKLGHIHFSSSGIDEHHHEHNQNPHGSNEISHGKHTQMAQGISDCKTLICGGMGRGAYESMRLLNIQPVVTDLLEIELVLKAYLDGKLVDRTELLH